jgi:GWxTD domain-containing protein
MSRLGVRLVAVVVFLLSVPASAETLPELFAKAKEQVKSQSWREALTTLDQLDTESAKPGNEAARQQLVAPIAFYRGVCEANLDQAEKAEADFAIFLQAQPGSTIDKVVYSKKAVAAFEAAGKEPASQGSLSLLQRYEEFKAPPNMGEKPDDRWADGPVKWIMTAEETAAWGALTSGGERAEFVEKFWEARNPKPGSKDNPARTGFDRRVAFADAYFQVDERKRGSMTDPGMVFVLLGPPTKTGRKPIKTGEDPIDSEGMSNAAIWWMSNRNSVHPDPTTAADVSNSFREIWHYRREALPKSVSINELNVIFITKTGIGRFVLQRDPAVLGTLNVARSARGQS